jgi:hypothetical protein
VSGPAEPRDLGFAGLLAAGLTPEEAWDEIRPDSISPAVQAIIADLATTREGREALALSREQWAGHGLAPPWELS